MAQRSHRTLFETLRQSFPNCFEAGKVDGPKSVGEAIKKGIVQDRKTQLFIRHITKGVLSERDLLLSYSIGEYFNEMSLFIEETERHKKALEDARKKK